MFAFTETPVRVFNMSYSNFNVYEKIQNIDNVVRAEAPPTDDNAVLGKIFTADANPDVFPEELDNWAQYVKAWRGAVFENPTSEPPKLPIDAWWIFRRAWGKVKRTWKRGAMEKLQKEIAGIRKAIGGNRSPEVAAEIEAQKAMDQIYMGTRHSANEERPGCADTKNIAGTGINIFIDVQGLIQEERNQYRDGLKAIARGLSLLRSKYNTKPDKEGFEMDMYRLTHPFENCRASNESTGAASSSSGGGRSLSFSTPVRTASEQDESAISQETVRG